jgi:Caspase domain
MRLAVGPWGQRLIAAAAILAIANIFGFASPASAQTKVALVIGNGAYQNVPALANPPHDGTDIATAFQRLGYSVRLVTDANYDDMRRAIRDFTPKASDAEIAVVFFAGHGMEVGGENWLIPVDAELTSDLATEQEAVSLRTVMLMVSTASKLGLVVLDACRNNPFLAKMKRMVTARAVTRGLSAVEPANNVLVAYAAKDGTTAADGRGRNSPFTTALLRHLETPGLEVTFLFRNVRDDVMAATRSEQQPFTYGSLSKEAIYLASPPPAAAASSALDEVAWSMLKETTDEAALKRFTAQYPDSPLRKDADARIAALAATQAAKQMPPGPDEVTWVLLKETTDEAALKRFTAQYPDSPLRKDADARIAALEGGKAAAPSQLEQHELARSLQLELKRVGCFDGTVNGEFDEATRMAWGKFAKIASIKLPDLLSADALKALRGTDKRVCPLLCPEGEHAQGDHCIAKAPRKTPPAKKTAERESPRKQAVKNSEPSHPGPDTRTAPYGLGGGGTSGAGCRVAGGGMHMRRVICR